MSDTKTIKKSLNKKKVIGLFIVLCFLILLIGAIRYLTFSLPADEEALAAMVTNDKVAVEQIGNTIVFTWYKSDNTTNAI